MLENIQTNQPGQAAAASQSVSGQQEQTQPQNAAQTEQGQGGNQSIAELEQLFDRKLQSATDRLTANFQKELAKLQPAGQPEQAAPQGEGQVSGETSNQVAGQPTGGSEQEAGGMGEQTQPGQQQPAGQPDPVTRSVQGILQKYGVQDIPKDAPEYAMVKQDAGDVYEFLTSVDKAAQAYAERLSKQNNTEARVPTLGMNRNAGGGQKTPDDPIAAFRMAYGK